MAETVSFKISATGKDWSWSRMSTHNLVRSAARLLGNLKEALPSLCFKEAVLPAAGATGDVAIDRGVVIFDDLRGLPLPSIRYWYQGLGQPLHCPTRKSIVFLARLALSSFSKMSPLMSLKGNGYITSW